MRPAGAPPSCPATATGVSANAGETKPAKLLTAVVVDANETDLTIPFGN